MRPLFPCGPSSLPVMSDSNFIVRGRPNPLPGPSMSLGASLYEQMEIYKDRTAQIVPNGEGETIVTHGEFLRQGKIVGNLLREKGLGLGSTVSICVGNTLEFTPVMLGTLFIGATCAPLNPSYELREMTHLLGVILPDFIFCNNTSEEKIKKAMTGLKTAPMYMNLDDLMKFLAESTENPGKFDIPEVGDLNEAVAVVLSSSGTSGLPKGVELSHSAILQMLIILRPKGVMMEKDDVVLGVSGPYWVSGLLVFMMSIDKGASIVLLPLFKEAVILDTIQRYNVNFALLGPTQLVALAKYPYNKPLELPSLRQVSFGGSKMSRLMYELAQQRLGKHITPVYGMTEIIATIAPAHGVLDRPGTVGKLFPDVQAKVVDVETRRPLGPNCEGEIMFKAPTVMKGYRNNPEATKACFDEDGFIYTGDIAYYDKDGFFYIIDRLKDLIKYKRNHVAAVDIEEVLLSHPGVMETAVVGVHNDEDQEHATGFVVKTSESDVTAQELIDLVKSKLPEMKWLHGGLYIIPTMPKTAGGKIMKRALRASVSHEENL